MWHRTAGNRNHPPGRACDALSCHRRTTPPVRLHPKIKGIPPLSDTKGGVQLTSVNQPAFDPMAWTSSAGAPVLRRRPTLTRRR